MVENVKNVVVSSMAIKGSLPYFFLMNPKKIKLMKKLNLFNVACAVAALSGMTVGADLRAQTFDWKSFSNANFNWSDNGNWIGGSAPGAGNDTLIINVDAYNPLASNNGSGIFSNNNRILTNDIGTVTLNQLNFHGYRTDATYSLLTVSGGILRFAGANATISDNSENYPVRFVVGSDIFLDANLTLNATNISGAGSSGHLGIGSGSSVVTTDSGELKTVIVTGDGKVSVINGTRILDGNGKVGVTMNGTGELNIGYKAGSLHNYSGGLVINSGTVTINSTDGVGSAGITLGKISNAQESVLRSASSVTLTNEITVNAGGERRIDATGGSTSVTLNGVITLDGDLIARNLTTGASTRIVFGGSITGAGNLILDNQNIADIRLGGNNSNFVGNVVVRNGLVNLTSATALSNGANTAAIATGGTLNINGQAATIAGLNGGGSVTNSGAARTLTLAGSGTYSFSGDLSAATAANLTVAKTGAGKQILSGNSTYTGNTTVSGGTLLVDGSLASTTVTVSNAGIGGDGSINNLVMNSGAFFSFDLDNTFNGFSIGALSGSVLDNLGVSLFNDGTYKSESALTLLTWASGGDSIDLDALTSSLSGNFGNLILDTAYGTGGFDIIGNSLLVKFTVVPEPSTWLLLGIGVAVLGICRRQRKA